MENDLAETDEDILNFDVPDDAIERAAAVTNGQAITVGICTDWITATGPSSLAHRANGDWLTGPWPLHVLCCA